MGNKTAFYTRTDRERRIFSALVKFAEDRPMQDVTVAELSKAAGISRSTFYRTFSSVPDVIVAMEDDIFEALRDLCRYYISSRLDLKSGNSYDETVVSIFRFLYSVRDTYRALAGPNGDPQFHIRHNQLVREFFGGRLAYNGIQAADQELFMTFAIAGQDAMIDQWLAQRGDISPEQMSEYAMRLFCAVFAA